MVEIFENIRKVYRFQTPCEDLKDFVEFFSESCPEQTRFYFPTQPFSVKMFASWTPTFYINLGAPYTITLKERTYYVQAHEDILILRNNIVERYNLPTDNIFTVKFYPGGLEAVLGINQVYCKDKLIDLKEILPLKLLERIHEPITFEHRVTCMQDFLLSQHKKNQYQDHYVKMTREAIGVYQEQSMQLNTSQVAEKVFVTSKTINRYFQRVVGITPKNYFSLLRARRALTHFVQSRKSFDPTCYGYYDMSHFYKNIIQFTGQMPGSHKG
jgi:AraC-like DNA-binding protein